MNSVESRIMEKMPQNMPCYHIAENIFINIYIVSNNIMIHIENKIRHSGFELCLKSHASHSCSCVLERCKNVNTLMFVELTNAKGVYQNKRCVCVCVCVYMDSYIYIYEMILSTH